MLKYVRVLIFYNQFAFNELIDAIKMARNVVIDSWALLVIGRV